MIKYVIKRLLALIPVILLVTLIVFAILNYAPGDPTTIILGNEYSVEASEQLKEELGINRPFIVRYFDYIFNLCQGDFGKSYITRAPVSEQIVARFPNTFRIVMLSMFICVVVGVPIGIYTATKPNSMFSNLTMVLGLLGVSLPIFWLGLLLILLFSVRLNWLPSSGTEDGILSFILPSITVGLNYIAGTMRTTRSSMLEAIRQDYIRTARAKGVSEHNVTMKHALPNALMPTITIVGMNMGAMLGGVVISETVFSIPGTGRLLIESINKRDTPCVLGCLVVTALCVAICNLLVDLIHASIDPRIKAEFSTRRFR